MSPSRKLFGGVALTTVGLALTTAPAQAGTYFEPLVAGTTTSAGQPFGTSLRLPLRTAEYQQINRASRSTVTLGFPGRERVTRRRRRVTVKAKPCARITYRLAIAPGTVDPLAAVRTEMPVALNEGTERRIAPGQTPEGPVRRAWRLAYARDAQGLVSIRGMSVEQLLPADPFGPLVDAVRTITLDARMLRLRGACGGADSFTLGPGVVDGIRLG